MSKWSKDKRRCPVAGCSRRKVWGEGFCHIHIGLKNNTGSETKREGKANERFSPTK